MPRRLLLKFQATLFFVIITMACPAYPHILHKITNKNCGQGLKLKPFEFFTQDWLNFKQLDFSQLFQSSARFIHKPPTAFCRVNADKSRLAAQIFRRPFAYILSKFIFVCAINTSRGLSTSIAHPHQHKWGQLPPFLRIIPIQKNNLTSLSRLAVLSVLSQTSALLAYFLEWA